MDIWVTIVLLGCSLAFMIFLAYINWRILIVTEHIARTTGFFIQTLADKSDLKEKGDKDNV